MKTISMPDHSDFQKAKAALLTTSVILFILSRMNLQSDSMDIFGLKVGIDQTEIVFFWRLVVMYFLYIFALRCLAENSFDFLDREFENYKDWLQYVGERAPEVRAHLDTLETDNEKHEFRMMVQKGMNKKYRWQFWNKVAADFGPPFVIAAVSILHSIY